MAPSAWRAILPVSNFIFLSSTKAGNDDNIDTSVEEAEGIYGMSKRAAEIAILEIASKSSMRVIS